MLLDVLEEQQPPTDLDELARTITERESECDPVEPAAIERVAITLHHHHLPKLADAGVIDYQPEANRIDSFRGLTRYRH